MREISLHYDLLCRSLKIVPFPALGRKTGVWGDKTPHASDLGTAFTVLIIRGHSSGGHGKHTVAAIFARELCQGYKQFTHVKAFPFVFIGALKMSFRESDVGRGPCILHLHPHMSLRIWGQK